MGPQEMSVANGAFPCRSQPGIHRPEHIPKRIDMGDFGIHLPGPIRLRIRIHRLYVIYDIFLKRGIQNFALFTLYGIYGIEYDASGTGCGLSAGIARLHRVFHIGGPVLSGDRWGYFPPEYR